MQNQLYGFQSGSIVVKGGIFDGWGSQRVQLGPCSTGRYATLTRRQFW